MFLTQTPWTGKRILLLHIGNIVILHFNLHVCPPKLCTVTACTSNKVQLAPLRLECFTSSGGEGGIFPAGASSCVALWDFKDVRLLGSARLGSPRCCTQSRLQSGEEKIKRLNHSSQVTGKVTPGLFLGPWCCHSVTPAIFNSWRLSAAAWRSLELERDQSLVGRRESHLPAGNTEWQILRKSP